MIAIVCGVGLTYRAQKKVQREQAIPKPAVLPDDLNSTAQNWTFTETNHNQTTIEIVAGDMKRTKDASRVDLKNLVLKISQQARQDLQPDQKRGRHVLSERAPVLFGRRGRDHAQRSGDGPAEAYPDGGEVVGGDLRYQHGTNRNRPAVELRLRERAGRIDRRLLRSGHARTAAQAGREARLEAGGSARQAHENRGRPAWSTTRPTRRSGCGPGAD